MTRIHCKSLFTVFKGYIDDSTHKDVFTLSCLLAKGSTWGWLSNDWKDCVDKKNKELIRQGRKPMRRYHASDCSNHHKDFADWTADEVIDFTKQLIAIFNKPANALHVFSFALRLSELTEIIPETSPDPPAFANVLLLMSMMDEIYEWMELANRDVPGALVNVQVALVHERGNYDATLQRAFKSERKRLPACAKLFPSLVPMGWEDCTPLQPTDFLAYETCKEVERDKQARPEMRRSLAAILGSDNFGGVCKWFTKENLSKVRDWLTDELKTQLLLDANLAKKSQGA